MKKLGRRERRDAHDGGELSHARVLVHNHQSGLELVSEEGLAGGGRGGEDDLCLLQWHYG